MLAVLLTYLSIEPKKETLHFSFSFYKFALFITIQSFVFLSNSQVIYFGEIISYFCITKNSKYSTSQLAASGKFYFKNANFFSIILF